VCTRERERAIEIEIEIEIDQQRQSLCVGCLVVLTSTP